MGLSRHDSHFQGHLDGSRRAPGRRSEAQDSCNKCGGRRGQGAALVTIGKNAAEVTDFAPAPKHSSGSGATSAPSYRRKEVSHFALGCGGM